MASRLFTRMRRSRMGLLAMLLGGLVGMPTQVLALGLGEIVLDSALNERLDARIPLVDVGGLEPEEIRVSLASAEDFDRVGVERFFFLSDLEFQVEMAHSGMGVVQVSTPRPITEPYLNFLVQVQWPQGRLLKEFTLLLDPPTFSAAPAPAVSSAVQAAPATASAGAIERVPEPMAAPAVAPAAQSPATTARPAGVDGGEPIDPQRMTNRNDTLWTIAKRSRPSEAVSIQQTMLAIQRLNPDAFLDGNINRLKAGYELELPTEQQALELSAAEALEQVAVQDRSWRGQTAALPAPDGIPTERAAIDATAGFAAAERASPGPEGRLRIVAGEGTGATGDADVAEDPAALAAVLEERDRLNLEVADLTGQIDREKELAANQIAVKDRQLEIKDQQIAEMQAELDRLREAAGDTGSEAQKQDQSAASARDVAWWRSPAVLGGGAGALVLLLAGGLIVARRRRAALELEPPPVAMAGSAADAPVVDRGSRRSATQDAAAAQGRKPAPARPGVATVAAGVTAAGGSAASAETVDVIGESDIYIAYGRFGQAQGLLQTALAGSPDRNDVRLKLLEVHARTGDRAAFDRVRAEFGAHTTDSEVLAAADRLGATFGPMSAAALASAAGGGDAPSDAATAGAERLETTEPDFAPFDFGREPESEEVPVELDEIDIDLSDVPAASEESLELAAPGAEDAELEFELDELTPESASVEASTAFATVVDEPADALPNLELDLDTDEFAVPVQSASSLDEDLVPTDPGILGGDRGIEFRLEAEDLDALDELELALEMDGPSVPDEEFDFPDDDNSASTKLDLARAYSEMGDVEGAREILLEVLKEGSADQQQAARELLEQL